MYNRMIKISENQWETNSDICGYRIIRNAEGYYTVYSFDECYEGGTFEETDRDLDYLQRKYGFGDLEDKYDDIRV